MNENQKIETDELITLYLDGEASERQQTELKRLMQHDPTIGDRIEGLRRQQQILNSLPLEPAPADLLENVRCEMERKLILKDFSEPARSFWATSYLVVRRLASVAAMVLLPLGLLALLVFQIVRPPSAGPVHYIPADRTVTEAPPANAPAAGAEKIQKLPFDGVLILKTDRYLTVSRDIEKTILGRDLLNQTVPSRTADVTMFDITASPQQIAELVGALEPIRSQCQSFVLQIAGDSPNKLIAIPDPQIKQVKMLVFENSPDLFHRLASRYAQANQKDSAALAKGQEESSLETDGYPQPSIPTLAGNYDSAIQTVRLKIQIERSEK